MPSSSQSVSSTSKPFSRTGKPRTLGMTTDARSLFRRATDPSTTPTGGSGAQKSSIPEDEFQIPRSPPRSIPGTPHDLHSLRGKMTPNGTLIPSEEDRTRGGEANSYFPEYYVKANLDDESIDGRDDEQTIPAEKNRREWDRKPGFFIPQGQPSKVFAGESSVKSQVIPGAIEEEEQEEEE